MRAQNEVSTPPDAVPSTVQLLSGKAHSWLYRLAAQAQERTKALSQPPIHAPLPDLDQRVRQIGEW